MPHKKLMFIILLLGLVLCYSIYQYRSKVYLRHLLLQNGKYAIATVTMVKKNKYKATPKYTFYIGGKKYTSFGKGIIQKTAFAYFTKQHVNKRFYMLYLPEDPNINSLLPYCKPPDTLYQPLWGWSTLPTGTLDYVIP